jgi:uncharacterized membrane protein
MSKQKTKPNKDSFKDKQAAKKAAVLNTGKKKSFLGYILIPVGIFVLVLVGFYFSNQIGQSPSAIAQGSEIRHPVSLFDDGKARHFQFDTENGLAIKYFVLKSSDGVIRAAFDACDVCWPAGKGYYQEGDYMVCRNCGKKFASVKVNEVKGGCNPAPLTRTVDGDELVIQVKDIIEEGRSFFDFSEGA